MNKRLEIGPEQKAAIRKLETALAACAGAGVTLCGMDDRLIAYPTDLMNEARAAGAPSAYEEQRYCSERGEDLPVDDHGAYRDSGGW